MPLSYIMQHNVRRCQVHKEKTTRDEANTGNVSCTLRLPPSLNEWLDKRSKKTGLSKSWQATEALEDYRKKIEGKTNE